LERSSHGADDDELDLVGQRDFFSQVSGELVALLAETEVGEGWIVEIVVALYMSVLDHGIMVKGNL
jgi:hypothetical protein